MRGRDREREGGKGAKLKNKQKKETLNAFGEELGAIENQKKRMTEKQVSTDAEPGEGANVERMRGRLSERQDEAEQRSNRCMIVLFIHALPP